MNNDTFWDGVGQAHEFAKAMRKAGGIEADITALIQDQEKMKNLVKIARGTATVVATKTLEPLLEMIGVVSTPATSKKFVAKDKFVENTTDKSKVMISGTGSNFDEWFLGKIEKPIAEQKLCYAKLLKSSVDGPIIAELGGEAKAETTLTEMFSLMEKQKDGGDGVLLNNGYANIFYIIDKNLVLRAVGVDWDDVGWFVNAYSVEDTFTWLDGCQVFSRNS